MSGSRISVEIAGNSASLQAAVVKAADSLKGLGDVLARQTDAALAAGDKTVRANALIARSYQGMAREAGVASDRTVAAFSRQGAVMLDSAKQQVRAFEQTGAAAKTSADEQVRASERAAVAGERTATRQQQSARKTEQAFGAQSSALTRAGKMISLGLLGAAAASVDLAVKFQANSLRMQTQAGATASQLDKIRKGLIAMAPAVGYGPNALASAMYHVVSSMNAVLPPAQRVSGELKIMRTAAQLAQVGHSNLEETTYALASAMNALHLPISHVTQAAGQLNAIVGSGDMTMTDLVDSLKSGLLPAAHQTGLSLQSVGAALAVMGDQGMRGAMAGTRLRMSIALLSSPAESAAKLLQTLGLSAKEAVSTSQAMSDALRKAGLRTTQLGADLRQPDGIMVALKDLNDHLRASGLTASGAAAVMNRAFGGGRMGATITLLAQSTDRLNAKFGQIGTTAGQFSGDWQRASHTTQFELKSLEAGALALGTRLGTDLLPMVNDAVHGFNDLVHWFEQNKAAADALGVAIGTLATVAIGSYLVSKLKQAVTLAHDFKSAMTFTGTLASTGSVTQARQSVVGAATGGGMIGGIRSPGMLPGSRTNPIVVVVEAGDIAGLGSQSAAGLGTTSSKAAQAEKTALQSAGAGPVPVGTGAAAAEQTAAAGIMSTLKTGLSSVLRGGMTALLGTGVAQLAGSVIPGQAGKTVSKIGTDAAIGAGAGTIIPGVGPVIGAIGGALVGGLTELFHNKSYQQKVIGSLSPGFGGTQAKAPGGLNDQLSKLLSDYNKQLGGKPGFGGSDRATMQQALVSAGAPAQLIQEAANAAIKGRAALEALAREYPKYAKQLLSILPAAQLQKASADALQAGTLVAKQLEAGWNQYKFQSEPIMLQQLSAEIKKLPPQAQAAAAESAVNFAKGLEAQGRLPKGAAQQMLYQIESEFPGLTRYMGTSATQAVAAFKTNFNLQQTEANLKSTLNKMRGDFPQVAQAMDQTKGDIEQKSAAVIASLKEIVQNGTGPMKTKAKQDLADLVQATDGDFAHMMNTVSTNTASMVKAVSSNTGQAFDIGSHNFQSLSQNIASYIGSGAEATKKGLQNITDQVNAALKGFGEKPLSPAQIQAATPGQLAALVTGQVSSGGLASPHATGGYIGVPGEKGRDQVPAMLGRGEAVLNHQQQALANQYLAPLGGLPGLFAATQGSKHWMAAGGYAGGRGMATGGYVYPLPGFTIGRTDMGVDANAAPGTPILAIGDSRLTGVIPNWYAGQPLLDFQLTSGPDAGKYWYVAEQIVPTTEQIGAMFKAGQAVARYAGSGTGIEIGWAGDAAGNTLAQTTGNTGDSSHGNSPAGLAFAAFIAGLSQGRLVGGGPAAAAQIVAPKVKGGGAIGTLAGSALAKAAQAANAYIQQLTASSPTGAGGVAGVPGARPGAVAGSLVTASVFDDPSTASGHAHIPGFAELSNPPGSLNFSALGDLPMGQLINVSWGGQTITIPKVDVGAGGPALPPATIRAIDLTAEAAAMFPGFPGLANVTWARTNGKAFAEGGFIHAAAGHNPYSHTKLPKSSKTKPPKSGKAPKVSPTKLTPKDLQELATVGGSVNTVMDAIARIAGGGGSEGSYSGLSNRFSAEEAQPQYLNADGSLNAKGYAKKIGDDQVLLGLQQQLLGDYRRELHVVQPALHKWLGTQSRAGRQIRADVNKEDANKRRLASNRVREASIRKAVLDLQKPVPNAVHALEDQIRRVHSQYDGPLHQAEQAKATYHGKDKATKNRLANAVVAARAAEQNALGPLESSLTAARGAQRGRAFGIKTQVFGLRQQLAGLAKEDAKLAQGDTTIGQQVSRLKGSLTGSNGAISANAMVQLLEQQAATLGFLRFGKNGVFLGIDTKNQGSIFDTQTQILTWRNEIAAAKGAQTGTASTDNSQLVSLYQQQNLQLSEALALNEAQTSVLRGMIPEIPHYREGGPVLNDGLIYAHAGEYVVPTSGTPVASGSGGGSSVTVEQHFHGDPAMRALMQLIDQRIRHPENVRAISKGVGQRTSMLAGRVGGGR